MRPFHKYVDNLLDCNNFSVLYTDSQKEFIVGGLFFSMIQFINSNKDSSFTSNKKLSMLHLD